MNSSQKEACQCLAGGGQLVDPKYAQHPEQAEDRLQVRVKKCWHLRAHFPSWVTDYCKKWETASQKSAGSSHHDLAGVGADHARRPVAV